jgi:DNA polymerase
MQQPQQKAYLQAIGIQRWAKRSSIAEKPPIEPASTPPKTSPIAKLDWAALANRVKDCQNCPLSSTRKQTVFGNGKQHAELMIIGEAPGAEEDRQGQPFVGRAGLLLNNMLKAIGLEREHVYIANVLKCRPPGNRNPKLEEIAACNDYLNRQIELVQPRLILSVGGISAKSLLQTEQTVGRLRGKVYKHPQTGTDMLVTYHPAYLLRRPEEKSKAWTDIQQAILYLNQATKPTN